MGEMYNTAALAGGMTLTPMTSKSRKKEPAYNFAALLGGEDLGDSAYNSQLAADGGYTPSLPASLKASKEGHEYRAANLLRKMKKSNPTSYNAAALAGGVCPGAGMIGSGRLKKGSREAKARMAYLRSLRGKSKYTPKTQLHKQFMSAMLSKTKKPSAKQRMSWLRAMKGGGVWIRG